MERLVCNGRFRGQSSKRRHIGMVSTGERVPLTKVRLPRCEGRPDRTVEVSLYRTAHALSLSQTAHIFAALLRSLDLRPEPGYSRK